MLAIVLRHLLHLGWYQVFCISLVVTDFAAQTAWCDGDISPEIVSICPKMSLSGAWEGLCLGPNPAGCDRLDALHRNNFISVRGTTGGLDVKHVIKIFVLLSLRYINRHRL